MNEIAIIGLTAFAVLMPLTCFLYMIYAGYEKEKESDRRKKRGVEK